MAWPRRALPEDDARAAGADARSDAGVVAADTGPAAHGARTLSGAAQAARRPARRSAAQMGRIQQVAAGRTRRDARAVGGAYYHRPAPTRRSAFRTVAAAGAGYDRAARRATRNTRPLRRHDAGCAVRRAASPRARRPLA